MLTVIGVLVLVAFITSVAAAMGKAPLWLAVVLVCIVELLRILPLGQ